MSAIVYRQSNETIYSMYRISLVGYKPCFVGTWSVTFLTLSSSLIIVGGSLAQNAY